MQNLFEIPANIIPLISEKWAMRMEIRERQIFVLRYLQSLPVAGQRRGLGGPYLLAFSEARNFWPTIVQPHSLTNGPAFGGFAVA